MNVENAKRFILSYYYVQQVYETKNKVLNFVRILEKPTETRKEKNRKKIDYNEVFWWEK